MILLVGESANREPTPDEVVTMNYGSLELRPEAWVLWLRSLGAFCDGCRYAEFGARWDASLNLLPPGADWDKLAAAETARAVLRYIPASLLLLAGRRVSSAFGVRSELPALHGRLLCLPHPSGRCRSWNDPRVKRECAELWRRAAELARGDEL